MPLLLMSKPSPVSNFPNCPLKLQALKENDTFCGYDINIPILCNIFFFSTAGSCTISVFGPSTGTCLPLPLQQKPLDWFKADLKHFFFQNNGPAMFSSQCCDIPPPSPCLLPVCKLYIVDILVCMGTCVCIYVL